MGPEIETEAAGQEVVAVQVLNATATLDWIRTLAPHFMFQLDRLYSHGLAPALEARELAQRLRSEAHTPEFPSSPTPSAEEQQEMERQLDAEFRQLYTDDDRHWINPLETQLPKAPNLTMSVFR